jgi:hypothetical protein
MVAVAGRFEEAVIGIGFNPVPSFKGEAFGFAGIR